MTTFAHGRMVQGGSIVAANLADGAVTLPALRRYTSDWTAWVLGGTVVFAHGLGVIPWSVQLYLQAVGGEGGWAALDSFAWYGSANASANGGAIWYADATNVRVLIGSGTQRALRKDTGAHFDITPGDWLLRVVAHG